MLYLVESILSRAVEAWDNLLDVLIKAVDNIGNFLSLETYNPFLLTNKNLSVSNKYGWYINTLLTMEQAIEYNQKDYLAYHEAVLIPLLKNLAGKPETRRDGEHCLGTKDETAFLAKIMAQADELCEDLKVRGRRFADVRARAIIIRDGLVSWDAAKAAQESLLAARESVKEARESVKQARQSTQLGQNVKLLTHVSIFFLPLSFRTSLWSITDMLGLPMLFYVMVIVATTTYVVVFNLRRITELLKRLKAPFKIYLRNTRNGLAKATWLPRLVVEPGLRR
ncbi:hypothetical protein MMC30_005491 [Trapelia coarctata]|nr:hypothetical protein [Trapelia coarctata]